MTAITLGEVTISSLVEIDRSSFPTPSMLPESTAEGVARHFTWLKPHFFDERTGDIGRSNGRCTPQPSGIAPANAARETRPKAG